MSRTKCLVVALVGILWAAPTTAWTQAKVDKERSEIEKRRAQLENSAKQLAEWNRNVEQSMSALQKARQDWDQKDALLKKTKQWLGKQLAENFLLRAGQDLLQEKESLVREVNAIDRDRASVRTSDSYATKHFNERVRAYQERLARYRARLEALENETELVETSRPVLDSHIDQYNRSILQHAREAERLRAEHLRITDQVERLKAAAFQYERDRDDLIRQLKASRKPAQSSGPGYEPSQPTKLDDARPKAANQPQ